MKRDYIWDGVDLYGKKQIGVSVSASRKQLQHTLTNEGIFRIVLQPLPSSLHATPLHRKVLIDFLGSIILLLESGISLIQAIELLVKEKRSPVYRYLFCRIRDALHRGQSLKSSFSDMSPLFSELFISIIGLSEKTGQLTQGLKMLLEYYRLQERKRDEVKKLMRYPKVVSIISTVIALAVVVFIIPMFEGLYKIYSGELPILTKMLIVISDWIHGNWLVLCIAISVLFIWNRIPSLRRLHPLVVIRFYIDRYFAKRDDPIVYASAIKMLMESGQSVQKSIGIAAGCMSPHNRKHGQSVAKSLLEGANFSQVFAETNWFPDIFEDHITSAENAGVVKAGFEQIYLILQKRQEDQFARWSKLIEPVTMLLLGGLVLVLLLAIYLPIFDLGNQI